MDKVKQNFQLESKNVGVLPIVNDFLDRLRVQALFDQHLEPPDPRCAIPTDKVLMLLLRNLIIDRQPLYGLSAWARSMLPGAVGFLETDLDQLNDDRLGRALDRLFDADRAALLTELVLHMIQTFQIDLQQLHNDSTSLTLQGAYRNAQGQSLRGTSTPKAARGHNKDHRSDLKQLLWILTVSSDGGVPVHFKVSAGQTEDSSTHIQTWNRLHELVGCADFVYVADSKLCTRENMRYIDEQGGRFITILPRSRKEDGLFRRWLIDASPQWEPIAQRPHRRLIGGPADIIMAMESPIPESNGFRIVWIFSSHKMQRDADWREQCLNKAVAQLEAFKAKLQGPKCRFHTKKGVTDHIDAILAQTQTTHYFAYQVKAQQEITYRSVQRGEITRKYRRGAKTRFHLEWEVRTKNIREVAKSDGVFPLITNDRDRSALDLFNAYRSKQPVVEQRHHLLKNILEATPVYLKNIGRLEALLFLEFIALLVHALIERQIQQQMGREEIEGVPIYPEQRSCSAPTTARLIDLFQPVQCHRLKQGTLVVQEFPPELSDLQKAMIRLAGVSSDLYKNIRISEKMTE
jgi:transposase